METHQRQDTGSIQLRDVARLKIEPDELLVIRLPDQPEASQRAAELLAWFNEQLPDARVLVLSNAATLKVVTFEMTSNGVGGTLKPRVDRDTPGP